MKLLTRQPTGREDSPVPATTTQPNHLTGSFDFVAILAELTEPMARRVAETPVPLSFRVEVEDLVAAIVSAVRAVARLLAEADAARRTRDIPFENRARAKAAMLKLAPRPADPEITDADIVTGQWAEITLDLVRPYSAPLSGLLSRAIPPHAYRGGVGGSASERVTEAISNVRAEARSLVARLDAVDRNRAGAPPTLRTAADRAADREQRERDAARAELLALGLPPDVAP